MINYAKEKGGKVAKDKFWEEASKLLNAEGPCVKSADSWKRVCVYIFLMTKTHILLFAIKWARAVRLTPQERSYIRSAERER